MNSPFDTARIVNLGHGVYLQNLFGGQITAITLTSMSRESITVWGNHQMQLVKTWPNDCPLAILNDHSAPDNLSFTPYMKTQLAELGQATKGRSGRIAVVVATTVLSRLGTNLARAQSTGQVETRFFLDSNTALEWLAEIVRR